MSLRYATLGLLAQNPGSGYDLLQRFALSMANVWPATQSQLYGELSRLSDAALIEASDAGPRGRKEYRITEAGRAELARWVTDPSGDPPLRRPDLLRVFLLGQLPPAAARDYAMGFAENAASELQRLQGLRDSLQWDADDPDFYGRAALEFGLRDAAMAEEWARWLIAQIDERAKVSVPASSEHGHRQGQPSRATAID
ncbi:PadR family transcriptional regulator [Mycobacterium sp. 236(2023)]|uniref:PadR family transcriptional regulator n=1 Tax=Mycobacterium sp. 236(2023) TaxID=3038163 RepID=UPI0024156BE6|nr:PadR family transcriptional regulator [Mycobacterium sp. 236(2023)]MDG4665505.1 PadR family transcriptional regulator [Mycobacterium sp. 236(2023)]